MLGKLPDDFKEGDTISATDLNQILAVVRMFAKMIAVSPLQMSAGETGVVLSAPNIKRPTSQDIFVKASATDTTASYLGDKLFEIDAWLDMSLQNPGGNESYALAHVGPVNTASTPLGQSTEKPNSTPDSTFVDLTATANAMSVWVLCSVHQASSNDDFELFPRLLEWDERGHGWKIGAEQSGIVISIDAGGADTDEKLAVVSTSTPGYLEDIATAWNVSSFVLNNDPIVYFEQNGANEFIAYLWWTDDPNYNAGSCQLYGHMSDGGIAHIDLLGSSHITVTEDEPGFAIEIEHAGPVTGETTTTIGAADMGAATADTTSFDYTASPNAAAVWGVSRLRQAAAGGAVQIFYRKNTSDSLGHEHNISAETLDSTTISFPDEKVAVASGETANYLGALLTDLATSGPVLGIDFEIIGTTPNKTIRAKIDLSGISGYSGTGKWAFIVDGGVLKWYPISPC